MANAYLYSVFLVDVLGEMLCRIHRTMLTASTAEREHQRGETTLDVTLYVMVGKTIYTLEEREYLSIILKKTNYRFIKSCYLLIWLISPRVMGATTVEHITSTIACLVFGYTLTIRETEDTYYKRSLAIELRECSWSILRMG
jgi:hypothetical protein